MWWLVIEHVPRRVHGNYAWNYYNSLTQNIHFRNLCLISPNSSWAPLVSSFLFLYVTSLKITAIAQAFGCFTLPKKNCIVIQIVILHYSSISFLHVHPTLPRNLSNQAANIKIFLSRHTPQSPTITHHFVKAVSVVK